jgi:hypothetical protein
MLLSRILITLFLLALAVVVPVDASTGDQHGWLLDQTSSSTGRHRIYLSPDAIKIVDDQSGNTLVSTAPDWTVRIYNDRSKRLFVSKGQQYASGSSVYVAVGLGIHFYKLPLNLEGHSLLRGMPVSLYVTPKLAGEKKGEGRQRFDALNGILRASYYVSNEIRVPKSAQKILVNFYGLPDKDGIPIELHYDNVSHEHVKWLTTNSLKRTNLKAVEFTYPRNYQVARREIDLLSPTGAMPVEDIIDMSSGH